TTIRASSRRSRFRPCWGLGSDWACLRGARSGTERRFVPIAPCASATWKWKLFRRYSSIPKEHAFMADAHLTPLAPYAGHDGVGTGHGEIATDRDGLRPAT